MTNTTWTTAPAGLLGLGGSDARPYSGEGTAVPFGGMTGDARLRTTDRQAFLPVDGRLFEGPRVVQAPVVEVSGVEAHVQKPIAPTNGTTLGIPSSSRPPS